MISLLTYCLCTPRLIEVEQDTREIPTMLRLQGSAQFEGALHTVDAGLGQEHGLKARAHIEAGADGQARFERHLAEDIGTTCAVAHADDGRDRALGREDVSGRQGIVGPSAHGDRHAIRRPQPSVPHAMHGHGLVEYEGIQPPVHVEGLMGEWSGDAQSSTHLPGIDMGAVEARQHGIAQACGGFAESLIVHKPAESPSEIEKPQGMDGVGAFEERRKDHRGRVGLTDGG